MQHSKIGRRGVLGGAVAAAAIAPLAACAGGSSNTPTDQASTTDTSEDNPFGLAGGTSVEAVIFDGGYSTDYVDFAAAEMKKKFPDVKVEVKPSTQIAQELQPRFVGGNPPDLIDNSGAGFIGFGSIIDQLETLDDLLDSNSYEGVPIKDTIFEGVKVPGTYDGKFAVLNYVLSVYGMWYSASLFEENGWTAPKTYEEAIDLGAKAKEKGKFLMLWGKEAATYYQTSAMISAIKEGGDEVRLALENLEDNAWSHPAVQGVFTALETIVKNGYMKPGGNGTQFTAAQAQWSNAQEALIYPSGAWIENEMKSQTKEGFQMTGMPELVLSDSPALGYESLRAEAGEGFIVPSQAKNRAGGKEVLRAMLSKEAATNFAKTRLAPTIVKDTIPEDGFGSSALQSQSKMLSDAGSNTFGIRFVTYYGLNKEQLVVWNSFLAGDADAKALTSELQKISDRVKNDSSIKKITVE
ncbi:N-acetylglucosamine/diacetylchitobiose ABC transporter substrate-binding protein [Propionibacteriaceae bacterium Y1923]|uniref:N-acetylglucosamine/diacetylchitobiose ABC transporter substrate-binding protein n=1 Tax=Aestuariimicrobium sp. Y1814 TaxID=3418742 RepID=UPI003C20552A